MVARLKLKGIDGRAPPEVNISHVPCYCLASLLKVVVPSLVRGKAAASLRSRRQHY